SVQIWFTSRETGDFEIAWAEHCGLGHYRMRGQVHVVPVAQFDKALADAAVQYEIEVTDMAHAPEAHAAEAHAHAEEAFIWKYVFSKNHRVIGIQYYVTAMVMALVAGVLAMLIRLQLAWPQKDWAFLAKLFP